MPALAQQAGANAQKDADDAFGGSVGMESVGIYSETEVRGFNPQQAGNARIDGVYFDQLALLVTRVREGSTIRVGFSALDYFAPSPTGIVAWKFLDPGDEFVGTLSIDKHQYGGNTEWLDFKTPLIDGKLSTAFGIAHGGQHFSDGTSMHMYAWGLMPKLTLGSFEIKPFVSGYFSRQQEVRPIATSAGPFVPKLARKLRNLGQDWAEGGSNNNTHGVTVKVDIADGLKFRGGAFRSSMNYRKNFTEIYAVQDALGNAKHFLLADPKQDKFANSWEGLLSYHFGNDRISHNFIVGARGRYRHIESGGSDFIDFTPGDATVPYGEKDQHGKPLLHFSDVNLGRLRQVALAAGYIGKWHGVGHINIGINKTDYNASFTDPTGTTRSKASPWLYNASLMLEPAPWLSLYGGIVTGLEDNGSAPENAANRNEQLPALKTKQVDGGIQVRFGKMTMVASAFQIEKPYFAFDAGSRYTRLGSVRHRGVEMSVIGDVTGRLHVMAGATMMDPVVTGVGTATGLIGKRPVGTPKLHGRIDLAYRTDLFRGLTFTGAVEHESRRAASSVTYAALGGSQLFLPSRTTVDLGFRHGFTIGKVPVNLRLEVLNVFDRKSWDTIASNSFMPGERRHWNLWLIADF